MDLHFPLALLAGGSSHEERGQWIIAWACNSRGLGKSSSIEDKESHLSSYLDDDLFTQIDFSREEEVAWGFGCLLGWKCRNIRLHLAFLRKAKVFVETMESFAKTRSPLIRVHPEFADEAFGWTNPPKQGMSYREFSVLCAVLSFLGRDEAKIVRRRAIVPRALGFWNKASIDTPNLAMKDSMLTEAQLRWTLDKLEERRLITRIQADRRNTWFSRSLTHKELADFVLKMRQRTDVKSARKAAENGLQRALAKQSTDRAEWFDAMRVACSRETLINGRSTLTD